MNEVLKKQRDNIVQSDRETGVIVTDLHRHGFVVTDSLPGRQGAAYGKYYIVIDKVDYTKTAVYLKLLYYVSEVGSRSPTLPEQQGTIYRLARRFLDKVH